MTDILTMVDRPSRLAGINSLTLRHRPTATARFLHPKRNASWPPFSAPPIGRFGVIFDVKRASNGGVASGRTPKALLLYGMNQSQHSVSNFELSTLVVKR